MSKLENIIQSIRWYIKRAEEKDAKLPPEVNTGMVYWHDIEQSYKALRKEFSKAKFVYYLLGLVTALLICMVVDKLF